MKILIIGSQGFIGAHTYSYFSEKAEVWSADVIDPLKQERFTLLEKSNTDFASLFKSNSFDVCINASGNGSVARSIEDPLYDYELNVLNTFKILESIRKFNKTCRYVNFSSAAVYGNPTVLPISESSSLNPISPYGWHKLYTERLCLEYFSLYQIRSVSLRIFSVYGEFLRKQLFWDIYQKTQRSKDIELFGTGNETRDFIYVKDLLTAISCIIKTSAFQAEAINVASGSETTIHDAAIRFCGELDKNIQVRFNNICKPGDPLKWRADVTELKKTGFNVETAFENGIKNVAKWILENT